MLYEMRVARLFLKTDYVNKISFLSNSFIITHVKPLKKFQVLKPLCSKMLETLKTKNREEENLTKRRRRGNGRKKVMKVERRERSSLRLSQEMTKIEMNPANEGDILRQNCSPLRFPAVKTSLTTNILLSHFSFTPNIYNLYTSC